MIDPQSGTLLTVHFSDEKNRPFAFCAALGSEALSRLYREAFSHPLWGFCDDQRKGEILLSSLAAHVLRDAGVTLQPNGLSVGVEAFFDRDLDERARSYWLSLSLSGKLDARKSSLLEELLRSWLSSFFTVDGFCLLPAARPIPIGSDSDLDALRVGWRAEAQARSGLADTLSLTPPSSATESRSKKR